MDWKPSHAYIPGRNARHPEEYFDEFKEGIESFLPDRLHDSVAWQLGLKLYRNCYFWEAHEMFEFIWKLCPPNSAEKLFVQAIIQLANSGLKRKMGMERAAINLHSEANRLAQEAFSRSQGKIFGFTTKDWPIA